MICFQRKAVFILALAMFCSLAVACQQSDLSELPDAQHSAQLSADTHLRASDFDLSVTRPMPTDRVLELVGGETQWQVISVPDRVWAQRIQWIHSHRSMEERFGQPTALTPQQVRMLVGMLEKEPSYSWLTGKFCTFQPGLLVVFEAGDRIAELRICFKCMQLIFDPGRLQDFDPIGGGLKFWAKDVFPEDEVIQGL